MKILFVIDKIELKYFEFNDLVTNFWFIKEFLSRGHSVEVTINDYLFIKSAKGYTLSQSAYLKDENIFVEKEKKEFLINDFDVVFFRPDPPVDTDYLSACSVFDFVDEEKTLLINNPKSIRDFNEKLHVNLFPDLVPENIVTSSKELIHDFVRENEEAVIKPLNDCFGAGVYYLNIHDKNLLTIIDNVTKEGSVHVMVQKFLRSKQGEDKRVLLVGDEVLSECILKLPKENSFKFSEHSDRFFTACSLTPDERQAAITVARELNKRGLFLVGLDMMDDKIIEINVTSPCYFIREINRNYGMRFEDKLMEKIEQLIQTHKKGAYAAING